VETEIPLDDLAAASTEESDAYESEVEQQEGPALGASDAEDGSVASPVLGTMIPAATPEQATPKKKLSFTPSEVHKATALSGARGSVSARTSGAFLATSTPLGPSGGVSRRGTSTRRSTRKPAAPAPEEEKEEEEEEESHHPEEEEEGAHVASGLAPQLDMRSTCCACSPHTHTRTRCMHRQPCLAEHATLVPTSHRVVHALTALLRHVVLVMY